MNLLTVQGLNLTCQIFIRNHFQSKLKFISLLELFNIEVRQKNRGGCHLLTLKVYMMSSI